MLKIPRWILYFAASWLFFLISACQALPSVSVTETPIPTIIPTETPVPATPTPEPLRAVWVSMDQGEASQQAAAVVQRLAQEAGLQFESVQALDSNQIVDAMRVIVFNAPETDMGAAASAHPAIQFVAITDADLQPAGNLSIINTDAKQVLFAGGYLSMMLSNDWRSVGLIAIDTKLGTDAPWAFFNGGGYFCGSCSPLSPPYVQFPLLVNLPAATDAAGWEAGYQAIEINRFNVAFLDGALTDPEVYNRLAQRGLILLGSGIPPTGLESVWAATIQQDIAGTLEKIWPDLAAGKSVGKFNAALQLTHVNSALLGEGKVQSFQAMANELMQGLISTAYQPLN